ncbi:sigma-70 family RNA polymerase sigma factor, partial [Thermodesulfobacteriota bacterium]
IDRAAKLIDPEAWVDQYGDGLFRFAWKRLQSTEMAEDVVQETFLEAIRAIDTFRGASSEKTWLFGILRHKIIDHIRKVSRERPTNSGDTAETLTDDLFDEKGSWAVKPRNWGNDPGEVLKQKHFFQMLTQCLGELPKRMAHMFSLRELEQMDSEEISRIMGVSRNNLGVVLHRARLRLRQCVEVNWLS